MIEDKDLNVKHFGAKGDGKTDDTEAIKKAFAAGVNNFTPGTYIVNQTLKPPDD